MAKEIRKATEYRNVTETWDENEAQRNENTEADLGGAETVSDDLQQTIEEEAAEYDEANKEDRLLDGDRATVKED